MPKVIVGMSGGVDSSIAAYILKKKGYEVEGLSFLMWESQEEACSPACCSLRATDQASKTALSLGISHSAIDVREDFMDKVIEPFVRAYLSGLTPNPCILCNRFIKFPYLIREAEKRDAEFIATGHYARIELIPANDLKVLGKQQSLGVNGSPVTHYSLLKKGVDPKKDQSYVLYALRREELGRLILPLGRHKKDDVRRIAKELHLPAADSSESQEICFVEEKNYLAFIEKFSPLKAEPGPIVGPGGSIIGTHKGIYGYTIGQRKGLGISSPEPLYVIDTDIEKNTVYVGPREAAKKREFLVGELNWIMTPPRDEFTASVKVRSTMKEQGATIFIDVRSKMHDARMKSEKFVSCILDPASFESVRVVFDEPQWAPAPGQSAVFYDGDAVIGGGVIKKPV